MNMGDFTVETGEKLKVVAVFLIFLFFIGIYTSSSARCAVKENELDNSIYADLLMKYVKNGFVDYRGFKNSEQKLDQYLKILKETHLSSLTREGRFAFYINAYNAWTIKLILTKYPDVSSIKDLGNFFRLL